MKAVIYARFSTNKQRPESVEDQIAACSKLIQRERFELVATFTDEAISGGTADRPGYQRMLAAARAREFDVVIAEDLSRLWRNEAEQAPHLAEFVDLGIQVVTVSGTDSRVPGFDLIASVLGAVNTMARNESGYRTRRGQRGNAERGDPTGGKCYGYRDGTVYQPEADVICEIFERFANGASYRTIAAELNSRGVPSPGSTWARIERRSSGWMGSAIRAMLRNDRYTGLVVWNRSRWHRSRQNSKIRRRVINPRSEWIVRQEEDLRIVSDELYQRAQRRTRLGDDSRLKSGGKARFVLSGLLTCAECGSHYVLSGQNSYACSGYVNGKACSNDIRVRRDRVEQALLDPVREELLAPERAARMAREMQRDYAARSKERRGRADAVPHELQELDARIVRLRARQSAGDPDMTADELQAALDRALVKRKEMLGAQSGGDRTGKVIAALPGAADLYRRQIAAGLDGSPHAAAQARALLREIFGGDVPLRRQGSELWAHIRLRPEALLLRAASTDGSGGRI